MAPAKNTATLRRDRRLVTRYPLELAVRYRVLLGKQAIRNGVGTTCDLSSGGVAFAPDARIPVGSRVELTVDWPVLLEERCRLTLVMSGRVVRSSERTVALRVSRHEFRTHGLAPQEEPVRACAAFS